VTLVVHVLVLINIMSQIYFCIFLSSLVLDIYWLKYIIIQRQEDILPYPLQNCPVHKYRYYDHINPSKSLIYSR